MSEYTPDTEEVKIKYRLASGNGFEAPAEFDRWLNSIKAEAWDEGAKAGLDTGLAIAENVHEHGGTLDLSTIPNAPDNPYRLVAAYEEATK